jgi:hypothetical protein
VRQRAIQWFHLAHPAAPVRVAVVQLGSLGGVLFGDGLPGCQVDQVHVVGRGDSVSGTQRLGEVVTGVQKQHIDTRGDLRDQVRQDRVLHRRCHRESSAEGLHRPAQDLRSRGALQLAASASRELLQIEGHGHRAMSGVGATSATKRTTNARWQSAQRHAPAGSSDGRRSSSPQYGQ